MSEVWKGPLIQLDEYRWRIPKEYKPGMRVDGLIFASKELIEQIRQDQAPEQVANVAFLPGIVGYSMAMPDIHWGYGFPVGGVAAMDIEEGVISPGGIGYDINCLDPNTRILTEHGYWRPIGSLGADWLSQSVTCFDLSRGERIAAAVEAFMQVRPRNQVYRLRTAAGYEITATAEHPFWTPEGMTPLHHLKVGAQVAIYPFEGVPYESPPSETILDADKVRAHLRQQGKSENAIRQVLKRLRQLNLLPLHANAPQLPYLIKILGYLTGGGTLRYLRGNGKGVAVFYGKSTDLERIRADISRVGFTPSPLRMRTRQHRVRTRTRTYELTTQETSFTVSSSAFTALLACLGAPLGKKAEQAYRVPEWLIRMPLWMQRLYLAALFGAKLSAPSTLSNHPATFQTPVLSLNKHPERAESGWAFLSDIQALLQRFGVRARLLDSPPETNPIGPSGRRTVRCRLQILGDNENLIRLWSQIGYEYQRERQQLAQAAVVYLRYKQLALLQRKQAADEPEKTFQSTQLRIPKGFPAFAEFAASALVGEHGLLWDTVQAIEQLNYPEPFVYDLTISHPDHNFVANGFVVSNCGVRLLRTDLTEQKVRPKLKELVDQIFRDVPAGFGGEGLIKTNRQELRQVMLKGAHWMVEHGYGWEDDLQHTEATGRLDMPDPDVITNKAIERGKDQLGTLGGGNHFLEIQVVDEIYDPKAAEAMGILQKGQVTVMIHTGSRGFGHQTCQDHLDIMEQAHRKYGIELPDRQLACAPIQSEEGQTYLRAMHCAANFAFANRQAIAHWVRQAFAKVFGSTPESLGIYQVYDVAHNIAKIEDHLYEGKPIRVCVHRKGATRAFPPGHPETPPAYREVGQPVLIPGDMGRYSYVLVGTQGAMEKSFGTTCHGAGRVMSRKGALREAKKRDIAKELTEQGIIVRAQNKATLGEEASYAYKDVADVVEVVHNAGIAKKVARLRPIGVVKG
ncbi:RNA-splicing ligase RtcB [bacterium HR15]|nr:RNA-splicing ligase RtcB [bacterium HR15]